MKYWLFNDNQVEGPYDREALQEIESFSPESLVCPEGRRGTSMGDWQRAGIIGELAEALLNKARVPAGAAPVGELGGSILPPEPTLRDLAVLGTLQEKVNLLENALNQFQEDLRTRDEEISDLKTNLDLKKQEAENFENKIGELEAQLKETKAFREDIDAAKSMGDEQAKVIDDLRSQLDIVRGDIDNVRSEVQESSGRAASMPKQSSTPEIETALDALESAQTPSGPPSDNLDVPGADIPDPFAAPQEEPTPFETLGETPGLESPGEMQAPATLDPPGLEVPAMEPLGDVPAMDAPVSLEPIADPGELQAPSLSAPALEISPDPAAVGGPDDAPPAQFPNAEPIPPGLISPFDTPAGENEPPAMGDLGAPISLEPPAFGGPGETTPGLQDLSFPPSGDLSGGSEIPNTLVGQPGELPQFPEPFPTPSMATPIPGAITSPSPMPVPGEAGPADMASLAGTPEGLVDMTAEPVAVPKKKGGKMLFVLLGLLVLGGGVGAAVYMGFIDIAALTGGKSASEAAAPKLKTPAVPAAVESEEDAPVPVEDASAEPEMGQPDKSQEAIEFAKAYRVGRERRTLASLLENGPRSPGLEPWTVDTLGDDRFEVNFYETKGGIRGRVPTYQFEVRLKDGVLTALNAKSQGLLSGRYPSQTTSSPAPKVKTPVRRPKPRPRNRQRKVSDSGLLSDPLGSMLLEESGRGASKPALERKPSRFARTAGAAQDSDETVLPPDDDDMDAEKKPAQTRRSSRARSRTPSKSREELTLDELLLPGVPKP